MKKELYHRKMKKKISVIVSVVCLITGVFIGIVIGMLLNEKQIENKLDTEKDTNKTEQIAENEDNIEKFPEEKGFLIETKYCDLYYPAKWEQSIEIDIEEKGSMYIVNFSKKMGQSKNITLFSVIFGGEEDSLIGQLTYEDKEIPVYIISADIDENKNWSEDDLNEVYLMQEDVNYLISMLQKEENFTDKYRN